MVWPVDDAIALGGNLKHWKVFPLHGDSERASKPLLDLSQFGRGLCQVAGPALRQKFGLKIITVEVVPSWASATSMTERAPSLQGANLTTLQKSHHELAGMMDMPELKSSDMAQCVHKLMEHEAYFQPPWQVEDFASLTLPEELAATCTEASELIQNIATV